MRFINFILGKRAEYKIVKDIEKATHWLAYRDDKSIIKDSVTSGKKYKLELLEDEFGFEYFIKDDKNNFGMHYMIHKGDFIKFFDA